jgi:hypothetical protein
MPTSTPVSLGSTLLRARIHSLPSHGILFYANATTTAAAAPLLTPSHSPFPLLLNSSIPLPISSVPFALFYQFTGDAFSSNSSSSTDLSIVAMDSFKFSVEDTAHAVSLPVTLTIHVHSSLGAVSNTSGTSTQSSVMTIESELSSFEVPSSLPPPSPDYHSGLWLRPQ